MMRNLLILLASLCSLSAMAADRSWEGLYQGTIGTAKVTVLLSHLDGVGEDSRYSYRLKPYDLGLTLEQEKSELVFIESRKLGASRDDLSGKGKAIVTGKWRLGLNTTSEMSGTWTDPTGKKTLPIMLRLVSKPRTDKDKSGIGEAYNALWAKDLAFAQSKEQKSFGPIKVGMSKDSVFKLSFPRIASHPDAERMKKINALFEEEHRNAVASARQCQEYLPRQKPDEIKTRNSTVAENFFKVTYVNQNILSLTESGSIFCGGAHPSNYTRSMNFDLVTAERLFESAKEDTGAELLSEKYLGRIFKLTTTKDRENFNSFWWALWMKGAAKATKDDPDCEDGFMNNRPMAERSADFYFTPKGLAVQRTDYAHAMSVCLFQSYNPLIIPWKDLKPWLKDGQQLLVNELK